MKARVWCLKQSDSSSRVEVKREFDLAFVRFLENGALQVAVLQGPTVTYAAGFWLSVEETK